MNTQAIFGAIFGVGMLGMIMVLVTIVMTHEPSATTFSSVAMCREACNGRMQAFNPHSGLCECQPEPMRCVP